MDRVTFVQKLKSLKGQKKLLLALVGLFVGVSGLTAAVQYHFSQKAQVEALGSEEAGEEDLSRPDEHAVARHEDHASPEAESHGKEHAKKELSRTQKLAALHGHKTAEKDPAEHGSRAHTPHVSQSHGHAGKASSGWFSRVFHAYGNLFSSLQHKVDELKRAEEENEKLRLENAHLRLVLESERYSKYAARAQKMTQAYEWKLSKETGSRTGRTIASIGYKVPTDLLPSQLYMLGTTYFKSRDDEKAAVIFTFLTGQDGDDTYKTPQNHLLTGIAWYRLDNFELADFYFDQVLHSPESGKTKRLHEQARLWKGLVADRQGKHVKAQFWLHEVMDHDPSSLEAAWVNQLSQPDHEDHEVEREPAEAHSEHHEDE